MFLHSLPANRYRPVYLHLTHVNANALLRLLVMGLGEMPARGREKLLVQILQCAEKTEACTLLVIDEAHLLEAESLIDLKLLANAGLKDRAPVKILLCGQETLRSQLRYEANNSFLLWAYGIVSPGVIMYSSRSPWSDNREATYCRPSWRTAVSRPCCRSTIRIAFSSAPTRPPARF